MGGDEFALGNESPPIRISRDTRTSIRYFVGFYADTVCIDDVNPRRRFHYCRFFMA